MGSRLRPTDRSALYGEIADRDQPRGDVVVRRREHIPRDALPRFRRRRQLRHEPGLARRFHGSCNAHDPSLATRDAQRRCLELAGGRHPRLQPDRHRPCRACPRRTRFPTLFERYSTRFGTRAVDPNLDPERATNYEIGVRAIPVRRREGLGCRLLFGHQGQHPERLLRGQRHDLDRRHQCRRRVATALSCQPTGM